MKLLGLIGYPLSHSFSQKYFREKFKNTGLEEWDYLLFPMKDIKEFPEILEVHPQLSGFNITIPHKVNILQFLDEVSEEAKAAGAVNTVKISISASGKKCFKGYNTDVYGFENSLEPLLENQYKKALILGTGGAAKAVKFVFDKLKIQSIMVSRNPLENQVSYMSINEKMLQDYKLIINTTPLGMFPNINSSPEIPYQHLTKNHLLYDLVYNPQETLFLKRGKERGAKIKNGLEMLHLQAEKAWEIWNDPQARCSK